MRPRLSDSISMAEIHEMRNRMSVADMAKQLDVSVNTLYRYLNGYKAQKPKEAQSTTVYITPKAEPILPPQKASEDDAVKAARARFEARMGMKPHRTELRMVTAMLNGSCHMFTVSKDRIQITNKTEPVCTVTADGIDVLIDELNALKTALSNMQIA